jgi:hypothetical protein
MVFALPPEAVDLKRRSLSVAAPQQRSTLELDAPRGKRLPTSENLKNRFATIDLRPAETRAIPLPVAAIEPGPAGAGRKRKGVRRFETSFEGKKFLLQTAITH